ncbi:MAG: SxtJ family membrane protein [Cyanobacteriota bacterium]
MTKLETIQTLTVLSLVFLIGYLIFKADWLIWLSLLLLLLAVFDNPLATLIAKGWMKFAIIIGNFNSKIILGFVFFVFLTPIAFLYRLTSKTIPDHFTNKNKQSFFVDIHQKYSKELFDKAW